jgi:two-component system chemotaxis response regulator CheB
VETLKDLVADLPGDLRAAICVVLHVAPDSPSALASILNRSGPLPCHAARDCDELLEGRILVAPPDRHLIIEDRHVRLTVGPRENNHRPAVDALFRSAATERGPAVVGVVLSGTRDDGTAGLAVIKARGGVAVVQDPADALHSGMPASAIANVAVDSVVPSSRIADTITAMVNGENPSPEPDRNTPVDAPEQAGSDVTICPECGGVLSERAEAGTMLWQCRVGHRYSPDSLVEAQGSDVEVALWTAVRALEDRAVLLTRMSDQLQHRGQAHSSRRFRRRAHEAHAQADLVRRALDHAARLTLAEAPENDEGESAAQGRLA